MSRHVVCVCCWLAVVYAVLVAGCGQRAEPSPVESPGIAERGETPRLTVSEKVCIPATCIRFMRVPSDSEKRSGLYAVRYLKGLRPDYPKEFKKAADGKAEPPVAGKERVALVGRFPGQITMVGVVQKGRFWGNTWQRGAAAVELRWPDGRRGHSRAGAARISSCGTSRSRGAPASADAFRRSEVRRGSCPRARHGGCA